jgi:hypothetical protein
MDRSCYFEAGEFGTDFRLQVRQFGKSEYSFAVSVVKIDSIAILRRTKEKL